MSLIRVAMLAVVAAAGLGCSSTGPEITGTSATLCDQTLSPVSSPDETTPLGFRAADVIAFAARDLTTSLVWGSSANVMFGPETGRRSLAVGVTYDGGDIAYVRSRPKEGSGPCGDHVRIAVSIHIRTESGALDETFDADLLAPTPFYATVNHQLDLERLTGTFTASPANGRTRKIRIDAALSPLGTTGQITGDVELTFSGGVGVTDVGYAIWPASEACRTSQRDAPGLPVDLDVQVASFTGRQGLSLFDAAGAELSLVWSDGSPSRLSLATTPIGQGCVRFDAPNIVPPQLTASFPITLGAVTDDGRLHGEYPAELRLTPTANGVLQTTEGRFDLKLPVDQVAATGFAGLGDVTGYDLLSLAFVSRVANEETSGEIVLNGLKAAPCATQPREPNPSGGTSPCEGTMYNLMERGSWLRHGNP
jgi:hypothetical protein